MSQTRSRVHQLVIRLALALLVGSLGLTTVHAQDATTLVFANNLDPTTLDPHIANDAQSNIFKLGLFESLVRWQVGTLELEPALAESWTVSDDGLTFNFRIRRGVTFHDGTDLDAEAVRFSVDRMKAIGQGTAFVLANVTRVEVLDSHTIEIELDQYDATFFQGLPNVMIVSPTAYGPHMAADNAVAFAAENPVGSGPYRLASWERTRRLEITKFEGYWRGWEQPHIDTFLMLIVSEPSTRRLLLERGEVDLLIKLEDSIEDARALESRPELVVTGFPTLSITYVMMANHRGPTSDPRVREAITYAFDYAAMLEAGFGGAAQQANGPLNSSIRFHDATTPTPERNLERARELLAAAGYPGGGFTLNFGYVGSSGVQRVTAEILQASLGDVGIVVQPQPMTWPTLVEAFQDPERSPELININNHSAFPDPDYTLSRFFSTSAQGLGGFNAGFYSNQGVDDMIELARSSRDDDEREALYTDILRLMVDDYAAIWNAEMSFLVGHKSTVHGFQYIPAFSRTLGYLDQLHFVGN